MSYAFSAPRIYDAIYTSIKDYEAEAQRLHVLLSSHHAGSGRRLLDIGCGTGLHDQYLTRWYAVTGLDLSAEMLSVARTRLPEVAFYEGDMSDFSLGMQFEFVTCLFSAIGHIAPNALGVTIANMARHLAPGGVLAIEPWIFPDMWRDGHREVRIVDQPDLKIARVTASYAQGRTTRLEMHHLVATAAGIDYFVEHHEAVMFTKAEFMAAFRAAGLAGEYFAEGLSNNGRGVFIATKPNS